MKPWIAACGAAGLAALSLALSAAQAQASCAGNRTTGTILGGVGGALIGNSLARGGGGAVLGGVGGALLGRSIAGENCRRAHYRYRRYYGPPGPPPPPALPPPAPGPAPLYYDPYGNPVTPGRPPAPVGATQTAFANDPYCRTETQSFYDDRGVLVRQPVKVCAR